MYSVKVAIYPVVAKRLVRLRRSDVHQSPSTSLALRLGLPHVVQLNETALQASTSPNHAWHTGSRRLVDRALDSWRRWRVSL